MALVLTNRAHQTDMIADWPWRQIGFEPNLQYLSKYWYFLILDEHHHPFYNALMLIYSELEVMEIDETQLAKELNEEEAQDEAPTESKKSGKKK